MNELIADNWPIILAALLIGIAVAWFVFAATRRARVEIDRSDVLDDGKGPAARNQALIDAAPAAQTNVTAVAPEPAAQPVAAAPEPVENTGGAGDDLTRIKGVGPKLQDMLHAIGVTSFAQIAAWTDADIARIDPQLGRFEGRITRDNWVEQAQLLARGDTSAYEGQFGKL